MQSSVVSNHVECFETVSSIRSLYFARISNSSDGKSSGSCNLCPRLVLSTSRKPRLLILISPANPVLTPYSKLFPQSEIQLPNVLNTNRRFLLGNMSHYSAIIPWDMPGASCWVRYYIRHLRIVETRVTMVCVSDIWVDLNDSTFHPHCLCRVFFRGCRKSPFHNTSIINSSNRDRDDCEGSVGIGAQQRSHYSQAPQEFLRRNMKKPIN